MNFLFKDVSDSTYLKSFPRRKYHVNYEPIAEAFWYISIIAYESHILLTFISQIRKSNTFLTPFFFVLFC